MNTARNTLGVVGGASAGYAIASLFLLTITDFGVGLAVSALCCVLIGLLRAVTP